MTTKFQNKMSKCKEIFDGQLEDLKALEKQYPDFGELADWAAQTAIANVKSKDENFLSNVATGLMIGFCQGMVYANQFGIPDWLIPLLRNKKVGL